MLEKAGLRLVFETFEDFGEDPHRHYVCVAADDESEARASIIAALGWNEVALTDVVARPAPRPCEDYSTAQQFTSLPVRRDRRLTGQSPGPG